MDFDGDFSAADKLSKLIEETARLHEESFDRAAADAATAAEDASPVKAGVNYSKFYRITLEQAAYQACKDQGFDPRLARFAYLSLVHCWNDTLDWVESIHKGKGYELPA